MRASCLCGTVQIKLGTLTGPYELCHCNRCKKHTGSAFNPVLDSRYQVWFCNTCGSPLPDPAPAHDFVEIPAGIIDTKIESTPDKSVFTEQSYAWLDSLSDIKRFTQSELTGYRKSYGRSRYTEAK